MRGFLQGVLDRLLYTGLLARACLWLAALGTLAAFLLAQRVAAWDRAAFVASLALAATSLDVWVVRLGSRLLQGERLTFGPR